MNSFILPPGDAYDKRCGEVFLTLNGNIIFHCTLCENKYKGIHEYAVHIIGKHFDPAISDEDNISTHSSIMFEEEIPIEEHTTISKDFDTVLVEEEEQLAVNFQEEILEDIRILQTMENSDQESYSNLKQENKSNEENINAIKAKSLQEKNSKRKLLQNTSKKSKYKPDSVTNKIRMLNEEAAVCLKNPSFKQPPLKKQIPESERKHKCNFCGFAFKDESNLIAHIKRHSDKKSFQCEYCSKMFAVRDVLERHRRRHIGERRYQCNYENCTKAFYERSELNLHIKRHKNERNFKCELCSRDFYDNKKLKEHFVSHTQERNHVCVVCNAKFSRRKALLNHIKLHENKREYVCQICDASFNQRPGLNSHMKSKHKHDNQ